MKKHIIILLCTINFLNGMNEESPLTINLKSKPQREPREWDAASYDKLSQNQTEAFFSFMRKHNIDVKDRTVLDIACGPGKAAAIYSKTASHVHGFDASKNMIDFAEKNYHSIPNLVFERCFAEDFETVMPRQLATASFCTNYFDDIKLAFKRINKSLVMNGELFATFQTSDNPVPFNLTAANELIDTYFFWLKPFYNLTGSSCPSNKEYIAMLEETGFEIIVNQEESFSDNPTEEILKEGLIVGATSSPLMQYIPKLALQYLLNDYTQRCINKLTRDENGKYPYTIFTTIVHARKIKDIKNDNL